MRRWGVVLVAVLALSLAGCREPQTLEDVQREAEFVKTCRDGGGKTTYDGTGNLRCEFWGDGK